MLTVPICYYIQMRIARERAAAPKLSVRIKLRRGRSTQGTAESDSNVFLTARTSTQRTSSCCSSRAARAVRQLLSPRQTRTSGSAASTRSIRGICARSVRSTGPAGQTPVNSLPGTNLPCRLAGGLERDGRHLPVSQLLLRVLVLSQVQLCANQNDRDVWRMMLNLRVPLFTRSVHNPCRGAWLPGRLAFVLTFSKLGGDTSEKQMRKTSVCGYDSGRRRS